MPCVDCVTMAMCNAIMHQPEKKPGLNAFSIYRKCNLIRTYVDKHYVTQVNETTWKTSFMCIQTFFMGVDSIKPHMISDNIPLQV